MSIVVTSWGNAILTLGTVQEFNQFIDENSRRGFEVKAMSTTSHIEKNGNVLQFFNLVMQRPVSWSDSAGQISYSE